MNLIKGAGADGDWILFKVIAMALGADLFEGIDVDAG